MNRLMPFTPGGAAGDLGEHEVDDVLASSWSPPEIHIFVPVSR